MLSVAAFAKGLAVVPGDNEQRAITDSSLLETVEDGAC